MTEIQKLKKENAELKKILSGISTVLLKYNQEDPFKLNIVKPKTVKPVTDINKDNKTYLRDLFYRRYKDKLTEITGTEAILPWSGKEGKLLNLDYDTHGFKTLEKYIEIFFSDKDRTIADFTRYKNQAGYSYGVFHGMLSKLALSKVRPAKTCKHCGKAFGHEYDCPIEREYRSRIEAEKEEVEKYREEYSGISIIDMVKKNLRSS